jgi:hypothetical protein
MPERVPDRVATAGSTDPDARDASDGADTSERDAEASRRDVLRGGALLAAGLGTALAITAAPRRARAQAMNDVQTLNALLTAEYSAVKAYDAGAAILTSPPATDPDRAAAPVVLAVAAHFQQQHRDHAAQLAAMVTSSGGTPVMESTVTFTPPTGFTASVANVIKLAANAEKAAAVAYADVLRTVTSQMAAKLIAAIGGVEAQHFIVLSLLARNVVGATAMTQAMAADVVPRSFVNAVGGGTTGLETVPDFTYA